MKHARADYDRIQDPAGLIPEDEPVFLIRAQDKVASAVLIFYAERARKAGASQELVDKVLEHAALMERWPKHKVPDLPKER